MQRAGVEADDERSTIEIRDEIAQRHAERGARLAAESLRDHAGGLELARTAASREHGLEPEIAVERDGEIAAGRVVPKVYRQFKMYNDPRYRAGGGTGGGNGTER